MGRNYKNNNKKKKILTPPLLRWGCVRAKSSTCGLPLRRAVRAEGSGTGSGQHRGRSGWDGKAAVRVWAAARRTRRILIREGRGFSHPLHRRRLRRGDGEVTGTGGGMGCKCQVIPKDGRERSELNSVLCGEIAARGRFRVTTPRVPPRGCGKICPCGVKCAAWGGWGCERGKLAVAPLITARNSCLKTKRGPPPGLRPFPHPTLPPPPPAGRRGCAAAQKRAGCAFVSAKQRRT